jgi:hypothetical protein
MIGIYVLCRICACLCKYSARATDPSCDDEDAITAFASGTVLKWKRVDMKLHDCSTDATIVFLIGLASLFGGFEQRCREKTIVLKL